MALEPLFLRLDRIAGGRQAGVLISDAGRTHPRTVRAFTWILWLLVAELVLGVGAVVVALVMAAIPGLYPVWMVTEQIVFSLIMIGIADFLTSDHMRAVFAKDADADSTPAG